MGETVARVPIGFLGPLEVTAADGSSIEMGGARLDLLLIRLTLEAGHTPFRTKMLADAVG